MPKGWTDDDPAKGTPHRRVREQVGLLLRAVREDCGSYSDAFGVLEQVILKLAGKRPEAVRDALVEVLGD